MKRFASLRSNASWMNSVPAWVAFRAARHTAISFSSVLIRALPMMPSGQIVPSPACGLPRPSAAVPRKTDCPP